MKATKFTHVQNAYSADLINFWLSLLNPLLIKMTDRAAFSATVARNDPIRDNVLAALFQFSSLNVEDTLDLNTGKQQRKAFKWGTLREFTWLLLAISTVHIIGGSGLLLAEELK